MKRLKLILLLAALDDEAFSWVALALQPHARMNGGHTQIWPDGLGGFRDAATIHDVQAAAAKYLEEYPR